MKTRNPGARAITMIDLLVVVVLGVLLASIAFPILGRTKEEARTYTCLANLRTIGTAANAYLVEYPDLPWTLTTPYIVGGESYHFSFYTQFAWGGGRPDKRRHDWTNAGGDSFNPVDNAETYKVPPRHRPLNRFISPAVSWDNPERDPRSGRVSIPMELPGCFKCPSDSSIEAPLIGGDNPDTGVDHPFTTWEFWGTSYATNWFWMYYYASAPPGDQPPYDSDLLTILGGRLSTPGLGRHMLKDKGGRWASRFMILYENRLNYAMVDARPRGASTEPPRAYAGWHRGDDFHAAAFRDGSARYMQMDTRYVNGPGWTLWPNHPWEGDWAPYDDLNP